MLESSLILLKKDLNMEQRDYHSHFGVYGLIYNKENDSILVIKKMRGPYTGMYDLPGGSPEIEELLEETLVREIKEETSCDVTEQTQIGGVSAIFEYEKDGNPWALRHLGVLFKAKITGTPREDSDGEDAGGCVWLPVKELEEYEVTPFVRIAIEKSL